MRKAISLHTLAEQTIAQFYDAMTNRTSARRSKKAVNSVWDKNLARLERAGFSKEESLQFVTDCHELAQLHADADD